MGDIKAYRKKALISIMDFAKIYNNKQLRIIKIKKIKSNKMFCKKKVKPLNYRKNEIGILKKGIFLYLIIFIMLSCQFL
jgi:hypothetical protein